MADVQISEVDAITSPFIFVGIGNQSLCNRGKEGMWFTVEQKGYKVIAGYA
jgi:hypothetical protein